MFLQIALQITIITIQAQNGSSFTCNPMGNPVIEAPATLRPNRWVHRRWAPPGTECHFKVARIFRKRSKIEPQMKKFEGGKPSWNWFGTKPSVESLSWNAWIQEFSSFDRMGGVFAISGRFPWRHSTSTSSPLTATKSDYEGHQMASPFHFNMDQVWQSEEASSF